MPAEEVHRFDRRRSDVVVSALATRVGILESGFESLTQQVTDLGRSLDKQTNELSANTALTEEAHGQTATLLERFDEVGPKIDRLYKVAEATDNLVKIAGKGADALVRCSDLIERRPKTLLVLLLGCGAAASYYLGHLPEPVLRLVRFVLA